MTVPSESAPSLSLGVKSERKAAEGLESRSDGRNDMATAMTMGPDAGRDAGGRSAERGAGDAPKAGIAASAAAWELGSRVPQAKQVTPQAIAAEEYRACLSSGRTRSCALQSARPAFVSLEGERGEGRGRGGRWGEGEEHERLNSAAKCDQSGRNALQHTSL